MAVKSEEKSLEKLEQEITCSVCQEYYTEPKVLPCLHYYCKKCVLKLTFRKASSESFSCPQGCQETTLPEGGVDELKTAFFIKRLQSEVAALKQVHGKEEVDCEMCTDSESKAEAFCHQCEEYICKECVKQHKRLKQYTEHEIVSLKNMKKVKVQELVKKQSAVKKCLIHEEPLSVYCFDCNSVVCRDCTMTNHKEHKFEFVKVAASDTKKKLLEEIVPLRELVSDMTLALEKVHSTKKEVGAEGKSVTDTILASFNELQQMLEKGKLQLLQEASSVVQQKLEKLAAQGEKLSQASASVQSIIDYTEKLVDHCSDNEVMSMHTEIREKVVQRIEATLKPKMIQKQEDNTGGVSGLKPLEQVNQKIAVDASRCTVRGDRLNIGTVGEVSSLVLSTNQNCDITSSNLVVGKLVSLFSELVVYCCVNQSGPRECHIHYTPKVRGHHILTVSVDGQQILGSPFSVIVSIPLTQLQHPVKYSVFGSITCKGFVVNSKGEPIVVSDYGITCVGNGGIQYTLGERSGSQHCPYTSIAIDKSDVIYCAGGNQVLRCNQQGVLYAKHMNISCTALTVVGDELMTCDGNNDTITIYDLDFNYVRSIEYLGMGYFRDISSDSQGNLYVAAMDNWGGKSGAAAIQSTNSIKVFSNTGNYLRSFGAEKCGSIDRVYVSGQYVYTSGHGLQITDAYSTKCSFVNIHTTAGDYVTSIKGGEVFSPTFLHVDKDEFVWVASEHTSLVF